MRNTTLLVLLGMCTLTGVSDAFAVCGDGTVETSDECDDGNTAPGDGCSRTCRIEVCPPAPDLTCHAAGRALLLLNEKTAGKERWRLQWAKIADATTRMEFGDVTESTPTPITVARVSACLYDDNDALLGEVSVAKAGQSCPRYGDCWHEVGTNGYLYRDPVGYEDGVTRIQYTAGPATAGKVKLAAANVTSQGHEHLPIGVAAALAGNTSPTMQLVTTTGFCVGATINRVTRDDGVAYGAITK